MKDFNRGGDLIPIDEAIEEEDIEQAGKKALDLDRGAQRSEEECKIVLQFFKILFLQNFYIAKNCLL